MKRAPAALIAVPFLAGCAGAALNAGLARAPGSVATDPHSPELALLEYRLARLFSQPHLDTVCAGRRVSSMDPVIRVTGEERLLARFPGLSPFDACTGSDKSYRNAGDGGPATMVDVHELECAAPTDCKAWGGFQSDAKRNGWDYYTLTFRKGRWEIRRADLGIVLT